MIKKMRARLTEKKGFTLAELLIVVAIIAVLVAIAIPIFSTQLEKSREATDLANVRAAYAEVMAQYLTGNGSGKSMSVTANQTQASWQGPAGAITTQINGTEGKVSFAAKIKPNKYKVAISSGGTVTVN
ncbi:type IV pilin protein [Butyrivibrio sp. AE3004]|uniref:type IV pilin protein n=1 Tax=Butyrivibrio sp. AE3004 TaxID=1506994 RepID=UPI00068C90CD|nr:prepilin-type N-terminal cleavage/methylation domain-containing protein [Butyrivibrio sp. AE3004]